MFPPLNIPFEYWIEHVTFGLLYVMFTFLTETFYMGVPSFATDCPCGVWCHVLATCPLYVGPLFGNLVWNDSKFVSLTSRKPFLFFSHLNVSQHDDTLFSLTLFSWLERCFIFQYFSSSLILHRRSLDTFFSVYFILNACMQMVWLCFVLFSLYNIFLRIRKPESQTAMKGSRVLSLSRYCRLTMGLRWLIFTLLSGNLFTNMGWF